MIRIEKVREAPNAARIENTSQATGLETPRAAAVGRVPTLAVQDTKPSSVIVVVLLSGPVPEFGAHGVPSLGIPVRWSLKRRCVVLDGTKRGRLGGSDGRCLGWPERGSLTVT